MMISQPVAAAREAVAGEQGHGLAGLVQGAHEGDHQLDVGEAHLVAHLAQGPAFELEARAEGVRDVARGPAEPEHGVRFAGLVALAADEVGVLVGLEVREPDDHGLGVERGGDRRHAFHELFHEERFRAPVARDPFAHPLPQRLGEPVELQQRLRMHADRVADDELQPREPHPGVGQGAERERAVRVADVHRDLERQRRHGGDVEPAELEVEPSGVDEAGVALGAGDGHLGPVRHRSGRRRRSRPPRGSPARGR